MRFACVVLLGLSPLGGLCSHIDEIAVREVLLQGGEVSDVPVEVAHNEEGALGLQLRVIQDGRDHVVGACCCSWVGGGVGPAVDVVDQHRQILRQVHCVQLGTACSI